MRCFENWLNGLTKKDVISNTKSRWRPELYPRCWYTFANDLENSVHSQEVCIWYKTGGQGKWLIHQISVLPLRGTSTGWRKGQRGISGSSTRQNTKSCIWGGICSHQSLSPVFLLVYFHIMSREGKKLYISDLSML